MENSSLTSISADSKPVILWNSRHTEDSIYSQYYVKIYLCTYYKRLVQELDILVPYYGTYYDKYVLYMHV